MLAHNYSVECGHIWYFFWPSSFIMILVFGFGVPWLFWRLIGQTLHRLEAFPLPDAPEDEDGKWRTVLVQSKPLTRSLFEPFKRFWYPRPPSLLFFGIFGIFLDFFELL